eukprot:353103_1
MATVQAENPFLDNDPSRLPCGVLEHFVYSVDRRGLLSGSTAQDQEDDNKYREDTDGDSKQANKSVFVIGDEEHIYYTMLQIQNEIEASQQDANKIKTLNQEMTKLIDAEEKKKKEAEKAKGYYSTPQRIQTMITRHYMRNFKNGSKKEKAWVYKYVEDHYHPQTVHHKPHDPSRSTYASASVEIKKQYASAIPEKQLNTIIMDQMKGWMNKKTNEYGYYYPDRYFTHRALPWLIQQEKPDKRS